MGNIQRMVLIWNSMPVTVVETFERGYGERAANTTIWTSQFWHGLNGMKGLILTQNDPKILRLQGIRLTTCRNPKLEGCWSQLPSTKTF